MPVLEEGMCEWSLLYNAKTSEYFLWYAAKGIDTNPHTGKPNAVWRIGFAKSKDGKIWQRNKAPVLIENVPETWDQSVSTCNVVLDPVTGGFHLFYHGGSTLNGIGIGWIGHAYSTDGVNWTRNPNNPLFKSEPSGTNKVEDHFDIAPCVVVIPDQNSFGGYIFEMFYFTFSQFGYLPKIANFYRRVGTMTK
jgi:hypothetical protein